MKIMVILILLIFSFTLIADIIGYNSKIQIIAESKSYKVTHTHDWSEKTNDKRYKMISTDKNPFSKDNDYAYLMCYNKNDKKLIFKQPCPAFTLIMITKDEKYIICLSKIKIFNPYQLLIMKTNGEIIKKRHFCSEEAKLTIEQFETFKKKFYSYYIELNSSNKIYTVNNEYFIDFIKDNDTKYDESWDFLYKYKTENHLTKNIVESVTNYVFWYNVKEPDIKMEYKNNTLYSISILDPMNQRIIIKINE